MTEMGTISRGASLTRPPLHSFSATPRMVTHVTHCPLDRLPRQKKIMGRLSDREMDRSRPYFRCPAIPEQADLVSSGMPPGEKPPPKKTYPVRLECLPITDSVTILKASCDERLPEIQFGQKKGTSTNSYLIKMNQLLNPTKDRILVDLPSSAYDYDISTWLEELGMLSRLNAIIITRLNPERIPALISLLEKFKGRNEKIQVYASKVAVQYIQKKCFKDDIFKKLVESSAVIQTASSGGTVNMGGGESLKFVPIPTARWPDLVALYSTKDQILFSSSFFAAHEAVDAGIGPFDEGGWGAHGDSVKYYFDCMLAPAARQVSKALNRLQINEVSPKSGNPAFDAMLAPLKSFLNEVNEAVMGADDGVADPLAVSYIAPIHGPVIRSSVMQVWLRYKEWTEEQVKLLDSSNAVVLYASAYGNTAALAQAISRGITKAGVGVVTLNLEQCGAEEVEEAISNGNGFVIGSPTLGGHMPTQVQTALGTVMRVGATKKIPCGVFGSFGWSGEAVDMMEGKLKDAGFPFAFPSIRCKFKPTEAMLQICEQSGTDLAQQIKKNTRIKEKNAAQKLSAAENASGKLLATGRIIGSLCVLTAKDGDAESGMLASWVSQASFDPPGLTIAVKKDRAIESLLPIGNKFVLNVLAEGRDRAIMREMVKPFAPGEDRFSNLNTERSEISNAIILTDAASYLECEVSQRMETGDHWLLYATVQHGQVLDESTPSAVHFRKVGSNY